MHCHCQAFLVLHNLEQKLGQRLQGSDSHLTINSQKLKKRIVFYNVSLKVDGNEKKEGG